MEGGGENSDHVQVKGGNPRRTWTSFEEEALLAILECLVADGHRCDTGSFKAGTLIEMAAQLKVRCPQSNLQASPHIESKLKKLKSDYSTIYDMMNTSGFSWNDVKKCIECDSNEAWDKYVQHNKDAKNWRNKSYPRFDRLANIFGKDRANGKGAEVPVDMVEEQSNNGVDVAAENESSPTSVDRNGSHQPEVSRVQKRKRSEEDKFILALTKLFEDNGKRMQLVTEAMVKGSVDQSDIAKELENMGLSGLQQIEALRIILDKPQNISTFKSLNANLKKLFVENLLVENANVR